MVVVTVMFLVMLPQFMRAQSTNQIATVKQTVDSIADMLATTPGAFAEIDRGYVSFPLYNQRGGYTLATVSTSVRLLLPMPDGEMRHKVDVLFRQVNLEEFIRHYPEVTMHEFEGKVEFILLFYPECFAVIGWFGEFSMMDARWTNVMIQSLALDENYFVRPEFDLPAYDLSNGLKSEGAYIKSSYGLGWRIKPAPLRSPSDPEGRAPINWTDWAQCRDSKTNAQ